MRICRAAKKALVNLTAPGKIEKMIASGAIPTGEFELSVGRHNGACC
jgi:hypothetical protein